MEVRVATMDTVRTQKIWLVCLLLLPLLVAPPASGFATPWQQPRGDDAFEESPAQPKIETELRLHGVVQSRFSGTV